ncbi:MAG: hypothetical protein P8L72_03750 [Flavobacteriaceae bacterium]|nr:hypothetical protein [Flavobacteriaceae bacterium]
MKTKLTLLLLAFIFLTSCSSSKDYFQPRVSYNDFVSHLDAGYVYTETDKDPLEKLTLQNNDCTIVSFDEDGNDFLAQPGHRPKKGRYMVFYEYLKYFLKEENNEIFKIGIAIRVIAKIQTNSNGVDLGSMSSLGEAYKNSQLTGAYTMSVVGIESQEISNLIPIFPLRINEDSQKIIEENVAKIKNLIYDEATVISPSKISKRSSSI